MSDQYTPELEEIRADWVDMRTALEPSGSTTRYTEVAPTYRDAFDRAIDKVRAEAMAEALLEAVSALNEVVEEAAAHGISNGLAWQTGALAMRDQLKIRADKLDTL